MNDYLLFVDTETSGIPKNWNAAYSDNTQWPYIVQLAWAIYSNEGEFLKEENYFIGDDDFEISAASQEVHGISKAYLKEHGQSRTKVMDKLRRDLLKYQPLIIGHYVKLDYHMLAVEFFRSQIENPLAELSTFCTMRATEDYIRQPFRRYLSLGELYKRLMQKPLTKPHNALTDAQATAACYFAMRERGNVNAEIIARQQNVQAVEKKVGVGKTKKSIYVYIFLVLLFFMLLIFFRL